jgi:ParB-like chromosome segregation protein Spo0J
MSTETEAAPKRMVPIDSIFLDPANLNRHTDRGIADIAASIRRFGQQSPIVVARDGRILKGNGTYRAIRDHLFSKDRHRWSEVWAVESELDGVEAVLYGVADNRVAEHSHLDDDGLAHLFREMRDEQIDLTGVGFNESEVNDKIAALARDPEGSTGKHPHENQEKNFDPEDEYKILITCQDEAQQTELLGELEGRGLKCRSLIV